ncbi:MAG: Wzz/FepE/Etk N-terminal domain-containing protein [Eubacteriales bacterium]|nr:Wzz/FepE/Etk N-terminal domain-containing protein [Eubacteriales bacterium]
MSQLKEPKRTIQDETLPLVQRAREEDVYTIDLMEIFRACLASWKMAMLAMLIGGLLFASYHTFLLKPTYEADASIFITNTDSVITFSDMQLSSALTEDYARILKSRGVLKEVISELGLELDYKQLSNLVSVSNPDGSHIINIKVTCQDVELARNIANALMNVGVERIFQVIGNNEPTVIDYSEAEAVEDVTPGLLKYLALGAVLGLLIVMGIAALKVVTDTTIKDEDDIINYLNIPVLAAIPYYDGADD